jgi:uncharacterized RDD family membrane protein YckC
MKKHSVVTIEFAAPGLIRMFAAMVYDSLLLAAISIGYGALVLGARVAIWGKPEAGHRVLWSLPAEFVITFGWLSVLMFFYIYFWRKFGQTLGMKTWRIQVVDAKNHELPSYLQAVKRSTAALFSLLVFGAGYWFALFHPQGRLLHDLASGTQLILLKKK